jgi:ACR3 family arsenite efflux pump ArsB
MTACTASKTKLVFPDRCLLLWIFPFVAAGIAIGYYSPAVTKMVTHFPTGNSSIPITIGLILLIYCPLASQKVWKRV